MKVCSDYDAISDSSCGTNDENDSNNYNSNDKDIIIIIITFY